MAADIACCRRANYHQTETNWLDPVLCNGSVGLRRRMGGRGRSRPGRAGRRALRPIDFHRSRRLAVMGAAAAAAPICACAINEFVAND